MPQRPPRKPPGDDEFPDTDRKGSSGFLDEEEFIETDDSLISDFDDLEAPAKPPPKRPAVPQPPPRVPRPPSQQMRAPREEPPPPPPPAPARPFDGAQGRRPPSQQMRTPGDDIPPPPVSVPARRPPQRAVALNRPAEEVIAPPAANIGSPAADTDMAAGGPPDGVRLIVVDGANKGEEYALERDIISLGRGADNDIVIRDVSVSRKHAKVIRDDGEFRLVDLGSGNGTLLNGRKVTDETLLSGAVFKMGNTVMRFVQIGDVYSTREDVCNSGMGFPTPAPAEPPAAPRKAPQPVTAVGAPRPVAAPGRSKALLLYGSLALVLFLAAAATVKFVILAPEGDAGSSPGGGRGRGDPAQVQKLFDEGIESFKKQEWKPAGEKFSAILGLEPQNERARQYKSKIEEELEYQESLQQAKEFVAKKILRAAIENLKKIPAESSYGAEARTMLLSVKGDFAKMRIDEGKTALAEKRHQAAYDAASEVLTVDPGNSEAVRLRAEAEDAMKEKGEKVAEYTPPKAAKEKPSKEKPERPPRPGKPKPDETGMDDLPPGPAGGPPATGPLASRAVGLFRQGNVNGAIQAIESAGSSDAKLQKLLADLRGFAGALQEGETYYRGKQDEGAIKALGRAIQYGKIVAPSGDNAYAQKIAGMIADMYYLRGVKAFYKENYLIAAQNFQQALKFKPDHQQSQNKLKEMSAVAGRLYEEGYVLKAADPEGAKKKFQTIIQITPPDNDYHKKAKDWLKRL